MSEAPRHNSYLFSVFNRSLMGDRFTDATEKFWQRYVGNADMPSYRWGGREEVMNKAKKQKDVEMQTYCRRLNSYLDNCVNFNAWDYPTKQQLANRAATLNNLLQASKAYQGKRLRAQYNLMRMRALLGLKRYQEGVNFWNATGKRMQPSVYRDMARNIYAGCLWRTGKKSQAIEVYAEQEDYQSLKYCVRGYRNLAGIQKVYAANPNSATLAYLVQDFVNNVQETMDVYGARHMPFATGNETKADLDEWMKEIDAKNITTAEANRFISFARGVVAEGKTGVPCLWQAAIGCMEHQMGLYDKAKADLAKAMSLAGTQRMKDNARAIYAANSIFAATRRDASFDKWLAGEMKWLDMKSAEDRKSTTLYDTDHYRDVQERMVYNGLVPMCAKEGRASAALVLLSGMDDGDPRWYYQGTYFDALNNATTDDLKAYVKYLAKQPSDSLESWAWRRAYREPDFYNDIIGTRLLAQARFADAVPFLEKRERGVSQQPEHSALCRATQLCQGALDGQAGRGATRIPDGRATGRLAKASREQEAELLPRHAEPLEPILAHEAFRGAHAQGLRACLDVVSGQLGGRLLVADAVWSERDAGQRHGWHGRLRGQGHEPARRERPKHRLQAEGEKPVCPRLHTSWRTMVL